MYTRRISGMTAVPVVVCAVLFVLTMMVSVVVYENWQSINQETAYYKEAKKQITEKIKAPLNQHLISVENLVGFPDEEGRVDIKKIIDRLNKLNSSEDAQDTKVYYGIIGLDSPEIAEGKLAAIDYPINIEIALAAFKKRINELQAQVDDIENSKKAINRLQASRIEEHKVITDEQEKVIKGLEKELRVIEEKYDAFIKRVDNQKKNAEKARDEAEQKRLTIEEDMSKSKLGHENTVLKKMNEIQKLQTVKYGGTASAQVAEPKPFKASEEKPDGEVLYGDPLANTVYINLGRKNSVYRGLKFDVYRFAKQGRKEYKGHIEIIRVKEKISVAAIKEQVNALDPLVEGDLLINPLFQENRTIYVTFAGRLTNFNTKTTSRFNGNRRAAKMIKEVGGKFERKVSERTNFVIFGDKGQEHPNYTNAVKFKIPLIDQETLARYIGD